MVAHSKLWSTAALTVAAGACFTAAAVIVYMLLKEEKLCEERPFDEIQSSRHSVVEVAVPSDIIGGVIGRNGANINRIQQQTNAKINFRDPVKGEDVRIAIIRGKPANVTGAERLLKQEIADRLSMVTVEMEIPTSACGAVIGKGGVNIRLINEASNAKVDMERSSRASSTTRVTIKGSEKEIWLAKGLIMERVEENEKFQKTKNEGAHNLSLSTRQCGLRGQQLCLKMEDEGISDVRNKGLPMVEQLVATAQDGFVEVFVSAVSSPSRFWVQLIGSRAIELDKLDEDMAAFYNDDVKSNEYLIVDGKVEVGELIAAPFAHDSSWYRAHVVEMKCDEYDPRESKVTIYYADYGERDTFKMSSLRRLASDFASHIPFQAIECSLANIIPVDGGSEWTLETIEQFEKLTYCAQWKVIMVKNEGRSSDGNCLVTAVDTSDGNDVDIGAILVNKGLALDTRTMVSHQLGDASQ